MWISLLNAILPAPCALCCQSTDGFGLCDACAADLPINNSACYQCAQPLKQANTRCGACQNNPPKWQQAIAPFAYKDTIKYLIHELKFNKKPHIAKTLAQQFILQTKEQIVERPDAIIPVPLHKKRLTSRKFNQSGLIAKALGKTLEIPVWQHIVKRAVDTKSQSSLNQKQRIINMRNAFVVKRPELITGKHLVLLDDVYTTGKTLSALCKTIQVYQTKRVDVWCIVRSKN